MTDLKKEIEQLNVLMNMQSPFGKFKKKEEPYYDILKREVEYTGKIYALADYVANMQMLRHQFATLKLKSFVEGTEFPDNQMKEIEEKIKVFTTELMDGKYADVIKGVDINEFK